MVSLPAIESAIVEKYSNSNEAVIAIEGSDKDGGVEIVMFSVFELKPEGLNNYLLEKGF